MTFWDERATQVGGRVAAFDGIDWDQGTAEMVDLILPWLPETGTIVDLGCGVGRMSVPIAEARPEATVVGVDGSIVMLEQAPDGPPNLMYLHADVSSIGARADTVAAAFSVLVVQHLAPDQVTAMFAEVRRCLRSGGRFVCQSVYGWHDAPQDHRYSMVSLDTTWGGLPIDTFEGVHPDWVWAVWEKP